MARVKSMKELEKALNNQYFAAAMKNVAKTAKNIQQEKVITEVYDKYSPGTSDGEPWEYKRRGTSGGLADQKNMIDTVKSTASGTTLSIENITKGKNDPSLDVAALVEYGDDKGYGEYDFKTNRDGTSSQYLKPRPFQDKTHEELESGKARTSFVEGLKQQGLTVK